jgi:hypothetical protein
MLESKALALVRLESKALALVSGDERGIGVQREKKRVGRVRIERTTCGLKVRCSTD